MICEVCSGALTHILDLVKDGTVYRVFRCSIGHHLVRDTYQRHLPVEMEMQQGHLVARVECGNNCFIFDRRMFRAALRSVFRSVREHTSNLVLDLSRVSLVGDGLLTAIRFLDNGLVRRNRSLLVVTPSAAVESDLLSAVPRLIGRIYPLCIDALMACGSLPERADEDRLALA